MTEDWERQLAVFAESLVVLPLLVEGVEPNRLHRSPAPGEWSAHVIVCHLVLNEMNTAMSLRLILTRDCPVLAEIEDDGAPRGSRHSTPTRQRRSESGAPCARTTSASAPRRQPTTSGAAVGLPGATRASPSVTTWQAADTTTASTSTRSGRRFPADASNGGSPRALLSEHIENLRPAAHRPPATPWPPTRPLPRQRGRPIGTAPSGGPSENLRRLPLDHGALEEVRVHLAPETTALVNMKSRKSSSVSSPCSTSS